jgi:hypothetical protein
MRRATRNSSSSTPANSRRAVRPARSNSNLPSTGENIRPWMPSVPPVSQSSLLASSSRISATPSVTIRRVRSVPRSTVRLATRPSTAGQRPWPTSRPRCGSGITCLQNRPRCRRRGRRRRRGPARRCRRSRAPGRATPRTAPRSRSRLISAWLGNTSGARRPPATAPAPTASCGCRAAGCCAVAHALPPWRTNRPFGRHSRMTIIRL